MTASHSPAQSHSHASHHVTPVRQLLAVFGALVGLTILTVILGQLNLGSWEIAVTMTIATIKAALVALFFMHLRYDSGFNAMVFGFSLLFVALFIGLTMIDAEQYQPDVVPPKPMNEAAVEPKERASPE